MKKNALRLVLFLVLFNTNSFSQESEWMKWTLFDFPDASLRVSSFLNGTIQADTTNPYGPFNLVDNDTQTAWVDGIEGHGIGESIKIVVPEGKNGLKIFPGYGKNESLFYKNDRPSKLRISGIVGINPEGYVSETAGVYYCISVPGEIIIGLEDKMGFQYIDWTGLQPAIDSLYQEIDSLFKRSFPMLVAGPIKKMLSVEITDIFPGSSWDDTCISEISFADHIYHIPVGLEDTLSCENLRSSEDGKEILATSGNKEEIALIDFEDQFIQDIIFSDNREWAILIMGPDDPPLGRIETIYLLYEVAGNRIYNKIIESQTGKPIAGPFFFNTNNEKLVLEFFIPGEDEPCFYSLEE